MYWPSGSHLPCEMEVCTAKKSDGWYVCQDGKMRSSKTEPAQTPVCDALATVRRTFGGGPLISAARGVRWGLSRSRPGWLKAVLWPVPEKLQRMPVLHTNPKRKRGPAFSRVCPSLALRVSVAGFLERAIRFAGVFHAHWFDGIPKKWLGI